MRFLKKAPFFLMLIMTISCNDIAPQKAVETDEEAIEAVEEVVQKLFDEVWAGYDETAVAKYQTADFLLLEHGEVWNNDTIVNWCEEAKLRNAGTERINNFERIDARRNGDKLWLAYHNNATIKMDTLERHLSWLESVIAVKKDTVWMLEMMHSTRQPR